MAKSTKSDKTDKILVEAKKRFKDCQSANTDIYKAGKDDLRFLGGDQWPEATKNNRANDKRPCLTINKLVTYSNQVVNDQRQNRPQIKVRPVDSGADPDTAEVINGLIRHIHNDSDAAAAFDTAHECAVNSGIGFFRIITDYRNDESFEQDILVKRIKNPFSVQFPFHLCKEADFSDVPYVFVREKISREEYKSRFDATDEEISEWDGEDATDWITDDSVVIAEYWSTETAAKTLYLIQDANGQNQVVDTLPEGVQAIKSRTVNERSVKWRLISGGKLLEERDWPCKYIPIIAVVGKELVVDDKDNFISLIRFAKDAQAGYNFMASAEAEVIGLAPRAPFIGALGQFEGFEEIWGTANIRNHSYLPYNPVSASGQLLGPPQRVQNVGVDTAIVNSKQSYENDIKNTTGLYSANLGDTGPEKSGRAIIAQQRKGDIANFHFTDNLARAIRLCGRIIIELIPVIIDTPRAVRILGEDMEEKIVRVNEQYVDEEGQERLYDVTAGKYDVVVDIGPSYATQRMEAADAVMQIMQSVPKVAEVAGDLAIKSLDVQYADEIADRIKRTIDPAITGEQNQQQQGEFSPEEIQQIVGDLQRLQQENEQLKAVLGQTDSDNQNRELDRQVDIAKTQIKADADIEKARMASAMRFNMRPDMARQEAGSSAR